MIQSLILSDFVELIQMQYEPYSILSFELKQNRLGGLICYIIFYISRNLHTIFDTKNNLAIIYKGRHRENELIKD